MNGYKYLGIYEDIRNNRLYYIDNDKMSCMVNKLVKGVSDR